MINQLINAAMDVVGVQQFNSSHRNYAGRVGCALITVKRNIYTGVSLDLVCGLGSCAEHAAICDMIKGHETKIEMIVALFPSGQIICPCGRCRELILQVDARNADTKIVLSKEETVLLKDILPIRWN